MLSPEEACLLLRPLTLLLRQHKLIIKDTGQIKGAKGEPSSIPLIDVQWVGAGIVGEP